MIIKKKYPAPVSVIIPCYQCLETITRSVESVVNQSLKPVEIILVDDGNCDDTLSLFHQITHKYGTEWIKVVSLPENNGPGTARNAGWDTATQRYIAFLDADDTWHPRKIEIQYDFMKKHPEIELSGHAYYITNSDGAGKAGNVQGGFKLISKFGLLLSNPFITPSVMLKRDLSLRFVPGMRHMEDHLLWLQVVFNGHRVARLNAKLAHIYKEIYGEGGLSAAFWQMGKGDLYKYWHLHKEGHISLPTTVGFFVYSSLKLLKRLLYLLYRFFKLHRYFISRNYNNAK